MEGEQTQNTTSKPFLAFIILMFLVGIAVLLPKDIKEETSAVEGESAEEQRPRISDSEKLVTDEGIGGKTSNLSNINTTDKMTDSEEVLIPDTQSPLPTNDTAMTNELKVEDLVLGEGTEATSGAKVSVNYLGTLTDGTKFDSSYDRGIPFSFTLGAGEVIKGWDMGVSGMKIGGKRKLTIPSDLAYGDQEAGNLIPPGATLVFEVELLGVE
tara:strand:+ start:703 stop:1338 length:636 start_codon:yes stop_codon:yes gene_type:complete